MHFEVWDALVTAFDIVVPSIVMREEAFFYVDKQGQRIEINLREQVAQGRIREATVC